MTTNSKTKWWLVGLLCVALWPAPAFAQSEAWERHMAAGTEAYRQGHYAEAEKQIEAALKDAEWFSPKDPRRAVSLNKLALLYDAQGKYAEAEPLYKRSLAIWEQALGPEHPDVAGSLNNLAELYRAQGRYAEARAVF